MLYYPVKYLGWIGFRVFFRKIYYANRKQIPKGKPIIFAVNHPTAFLDPVLAGTFISPTVHFLVRGDIFENNTVRKILASLKKEHIKSCHSSKLDVIQIQKIMRKP